jgi:hypothetical protein
MNLACNRSKNKEIQSWIGKKEHDPLFIRDEKKMRQKREGKKAARK